jgi:hypothetical protein
VITGINYTSYLVGQTVADGFYATNNPTSYLATGLPPGMKQNIGNTITGTAKTAGSYSVVLSATNSAGTSTPYPVTMTVYPSTPPTVLINSPASGTSIYGPIDVSLSATANSTDTPASNIVSVTYYQGSTKIGAVTSDGTSNPYVYNWKSVAIGSYTITAVAKDDAGLTSTSSSVTMTVLQDAPPVVSITSPADGSSFERPADVALTAAASSPDVSVASVEFYKGSTKIGAAMYNSGVWVYSWDRVAAGTYSVTAVATDTCGLSTTSAPISITVN